MSSFATDLIFSSTFSQITRSIEASIQTKCQTAIAANSAAKAQDIYPTDGQIN